MGFKKQIDEYLVMYSANTFAPRIGMRSKGAYLGQAVFHPNGKVLPADLLRPDGSVDLMYHLEDFQNIIDVLRNEKPVFLMFSGVGPGFENAIGTNYEVAGEGEA